MSRYLDYLAKTGRHQQAAWMYLKAQEPLKAAREYLELGVQEKTISVLHYFGHHDHLLTHLKR